MKTHLAAAVAALLAASVAAPVLADETTGHVAAYDRVAHVLVLTDMTMWELPDSIVLPEDLGRGDRVLIGYESAGEDGLTAITAIERIAIALDADSDGGV